jgi:hypothetical protein
MVGADMSQQIRYWLEYLDACESPIERQMWAGLLHAIGAGELAKCGVRYYTQFPETVGDQNIRIDIAIVVPTFGVKVAVELDGHDFHERTKEQAKRDKSRDRALTAKGWTVLRFTGSEVHADALKCWAEVFKVCLRLIESPEPEVKAS